MTKKTWWRSRLVWIAGAGLIALLLVDLGLFGWLIFRSLSRAEIERVLGETRDLAAELARRIETGAGRSGGDLFTALLLEEETLTSIDEVIRERQIVRTLEVRDPEGRLVLRRRTEEERFRPELSVPSPEARGRSPQAATRTLERRESFPILLPREPLVDLEVEVPIGELGSLHFSLAAEPVRRRVEEFRRRLLEQALWLGAVTLVLGAGSLYALARLARRSEQFESQAREAERLAELGALAAGLAHEIRNPLNALSLNLQVLEEGKHFAPSEDSLLRNARSEVERLNRLVSEFLAYARPRPPRKQRVLARELFQAVCELLAAEVERRSARIEIDPGGADLEVVVDREQMVQVLLNLVRNALEAGQEAQVAVRIELRAARSDQGIEISVSDDGPGMDAVTQEKAFDLFYSNRRGGSGLGLAIVARIVAAHDGDVVIESAPGAGTRVRIRLPEGQDLGLSPGPPPPISASNSSSVTN